MLFSFVLLLSSLVFSEARIPQLEVYEIRENGRDLKIRPLHAHNQRESKLSQLLSAIQNTHTHIYTSSSDENSDVIYLNGNNDASLPIWNGNDDFVDKTRSFEIKRKHNDFIREVLYELLKNKEAAKPKQRFLRSQTMVDDRTAAPRHRYRYDDDEE